MNYSILIICSIFILAALGQHIPRKLRDPNRPHRKIGDVLKHIGRQRGSRVQNPNENVNFTKITEDAFAKSGDQKFDCDNLYPGNYPVMARACKDYFYQCAVGRRYGTPTRCPAGTLYDEEQDLCIEKAFIPACGGKARDPNHAVDAAQNPLPEYLCDKVGTIPDPRSPYQTQWGVCSQSWYYCSQANAWPSQMSCPTGLFYDIDREMCLKKNEVFGCTGQEVKPEGIEEKDKDGIKRNEQVKNAISTRIPAPDGFCDDKIPGQYPIKAGACSPEYVACQGSRGTIYTCNQANNEFYDEEFNRCEFPDMLPACGGKRKESPQSDSGRAFEEEKKNSLFPFACSQSGYIEDPRDEFKTQWGICSQSWFYCHGPDASPSQLQCPANLYYDVNIAQCNIRQAVYACSGKSLNDPNQNQQAQPSGSLARTQEAPPNEQPEMNNDKQVNGPQEKQVSQKTKQDLNKLCESKQDGAYSIDGGNCLKEFIICSKSEGYLIECTGKTVFSIKRNQCIDKNRCE